MCCRLHAARMLLAFPFLLVGVGAEGEAKRSYGWSRYRYTRYDKFPNAQDQESAILAGGDIKCEVCEVILGDVLQELYQSNRLGGKSDQDIVLEALEAEYIDEEKVSNAASEMEEYVEKNKKGCNRFFKERFLQLGWNVENCPKPSTRGPDDKSPADLMVPWACAKFKGPGVSPTAQELNTYTVENEAIHYACDVTIARHGDEVAEYVAENHKQYQSRRLKEFASLACSKAAKCLKRQPSESLMSRAIKMQGLQRSYDIMVDEELKNIEKQLKEEKKEEEDKNKSKFDDDIEQVDV